MFVKISGLNLCEAVRNGFPIESRQSEASRAARALMDRGESEWDGRQDIR
jgi:hypothetical protein